MKKIKEKDAIIEITKNKIKVINLKLKETEKKSQEKEEELLNEQKEKLIEYQKDIGILENEFLNMQKLNQKYIRMSKSCCQHIP